MVTIQSFSGCIFFGSKVYWFTSKEIFSAAGCPFKVDLLRNPTAPLKTGCSAENRTRRSTIEELFLPLEAEERGRERMLGKYIQLPHGMLCNFLALLLETKSSRSIVTAGDQAQKNGGKGVTGKGSCTASSVLGCLHTG